MIRKNIITGIILGILILGFYGCNMQDNDNNNNTNINMTNPASTYCIEQGGTLEIVDGSIGYCTLTTKEVCEEWSYFRGECPQKDNETSDSYAKICTMEYAPVCAVDNKTYSNKCMAGNISINHEGECS